MSGTEVERSAAPPRRAIPCPRCGVSVHGDQDWCLECGLAARTRLARTPGWRGPAALIGLIGLAAIVALVVAFLVITGDNAPLPTTAQPATATTAPPATTTIPAGTATTPVTTTPTTPGPQTTPVTTTPTVPATPTVATTPAPAP